VWDHRLEDLAFEDAFYQRYGWTSQQLDDTPQWKIEGLPRVWAAKQAVARRRQVAAQTADRARKGHAV
jgi:hypothetical protein